MCLHTLRVRAVPQRKLPYRESGIPRRDFFNRKFFRNFLLKKYPAGYGGVSEIILIHKYCYASFSFISFSIISSKCVLSGKMKENLFSNQHPAKSAHLAASDCICFLLAAVACVASASPCIPSSKVHMPVVTNVVPEPIHHLL